MTTRASVVTIIFVAVWSVACGSPDTAPSAMPQTQPGTGLQIAGVSVRASLENWANAPWDIGYTYCFSIGPATPDVQTMTFRRADYTTIGPAGEIYNTSSARSLIGQTIGGGRGGCFFTYQDQNITRAVATTYRLSFEYGPPESGRPFAQSVSGTISSSVPPQPFITGVTLTHDLGDGQRVLRQPRPITFTVTNVAGGTPPFLYRWRLNGFVLRDWDPNPVLLWDGVTLAGGRVGSGGYTLAVTVRSSTFPQQEAGSAVDFVLLF